MAYTKKGYNLNSLANLSKGMQPPKLMYSDTRSQELVNAMLDEMVDYNGVTVTVREAILRSQVKKALEEGDLRSCQFLVELAGCNEQNAPSIKTGTVSPLEQLQAMMRKSSIDDRRRKIPNTR